MWASVVALPVYQKQVTELFAGSEAAAMEDYIAANPEGHPVLQGTGGLRKARWKRGTRGKSGGVRAIYYFDVRAATVYMLTVYSKSQKENLTAADKRDLRKIVDRIKGREE